MTARAEQSVAGEDARLEAVLADPASSYWLKESLSAALKRDPVDALNDALVLAESLDWHLRTVMGLTGEEGGD